MPHFIKKKQKNIRIIRAREGRNEDRKQRNRGSVAWKGRQRCHLLGFEERASGFSISRHSNRHESKNKIGRKWWINQRREVVSDSKFSRNRDRANLERIEREILMVPFGVGFASALFSVSAF